MEVWRVYLASITLTPYLVVGGALVLGGIVLAVQTVTFARRQRNRLARYPVRGQQLDNRSLIAHLALSFVPVCLGVEVFTTPTDVIPSTGVNTSVLVLAVILCFTCILLSAYTSR
jgi:hypothetical protein